MAKSKFTFCYAAFGIILILFLAVHIILRLDINLPFMADMFKDKVFDTDPQSCYLVYCKGSEAYSDLGLRKSRLITPQTKLQKGMTLHTGSDGTVCFYIKSYGYMHIYPNSIVYINDLAHFIQDTNEDIYKNTEFIIEKGSVFFSLNTFADNSDITLRTDTAVCSIVKGDFLVECSDSFNTVIKCLKGSAYYWPQSEVLDKQPGFNNRGKHLTVSTFFDKGELTENHQVIITSKDCMSFDQLLQQTYQSSVITSLDINYFLQHSTVQASPIDVDQRGVSPLRLYQNKNNFDDVAYVEVSAKNDCYYKFDETDIETNKRYVFLVTSGIHTLRTDDYAWDFNIYPEEIRVVPF